MSRTYCALQDEKTLARGEKSVCIDEVGSAALCVEWLTVVKGKHIEHDIAVEEALTSKPTQYHIRTHSG